MKRVLRRTLTAQNLWSSLGVLASLGLAGCPIDERTLIAADNSVSGSSSSGTSSSAGEGGSGAEPGGEPGGTSGVGGDGGEPPVTAGASSGTAGSAGSAGATAGTAGSAGTAGDGGTAGTGGASGTGGTGTGASAACPDIDGNGVVDCEETLATNADFDADYEEWNPLSSTILAWNELDAREASSSGSVDVFNEAEGGATTATISGGSQCSNAYAGEWYLFAAEVFVPQGQTPGGFGALNMIFFDQPDCMGMFLDGGFAPSSSNDFWQTVTLTEKAPAGAVSVEIRLGTVKPLNAPPYVARFDNILFRQIEME